MNSQNKKLSHGTKYFKRAQDLVVGFIIATFFASFITAAYGVSGQLNFLILQAIWLIGLPALVFLFDSVSKLSNKYANIPNNNKKILYSGDYDNLVSELFDSGFLLQSKIDKFYQFTSYVSLVRTHALLVTKEGIEYYISGEEEIITAISKDFVPYVLGVEVINTHANVKEKKRGHKIADFCASKKLITNQKNITPKPEEEENRRS